MTYAQNSAVEAVAHIGDPCRQCGLGHDDVPPGPCQGKRWNCRCCRTEFWHVGEARPNCPVCKAWDQYTYEGPYIEADKAIPTPSDQEKLEGWQPIETCPVRRYVLFRFEGLFHDSECPGVAVGKLADSGVFWLTAIWAGTTPHRDPVAWATLQTTPAVSGEG